MILRRIKAHVEKENWFAVGIDFLIVVVGVFIGIQVANWNEARQDYQAYEKAHNRMVDEINRNIASAKNSVQIIEPSIKSVELTIEDLRQCNTDEAAKLRMDNALIAIMTTHSLRVDNRAANTISTSERLLEQQPEALRQLYAEYSRQLQTVIDYSASWQLVMEQQFDDSPPYFDYGPRTTSTGTALQILYRPLILTEDLSVVCQNSEVHKLFYRWENGSMYQLNLFNNFIRTSETFLNTIKDIPLNGDTE